MQVFNVDLDFLTRGQYCRPCKIETRYRIPAEVKPRVAGLKRVLDLLADPNIASKEWVFRMYDHEVRGGTVVKPASGIMNWRAVRRLVVVAAARSGGGWPGLG